jgi:hypothetical protein
MSGNEFVRLRLSVIIEPLDDHCRMWRRLEDHAYGTTSWREPVCFEEPRRIALAAFPHGNIDRRMTRGVGQGMTIRLHLLSSLPAGSIGMRGNGPSDGTAAA